MDELFSYRFHVAEVPIRICSDQPLAVGEPFGPFLAAPAAEGVTVLLRQVEHLPRHGAEILLTENCYRVYPDGRGGFLRGFYDVHRKSEDYAMQQQENAGKRIIVDYLATGARFVKSMDNVFFHMGLEGVLIRERKLCCHAALVQTAFGGILFSGPSGIGKSTQADLWCRLENAVQLNGDRPVVGRKDGRWYGWGSPYAGSSRCYVNRGCPIAAIVVLQQAPACSICRLPVTQGFRRIYEGLAVNQWDPDFCLTAFDLAVQLAEDVPVYELACTPDGAAVALLKDQLERELGKG